MKIFLGIGVVLVFGYMVDGQTTPRPKCPPREKWVDCGTCEPTCDDLKPVCTQECQPPRCQCRQNFVRCNETGECIHKKLCNTTQPVRQKRQAPLTTTTLPGMTTTTTSPLGINPVNLGGPMIPVNPNQPAQINPFNPGPMIPRPENCRDDEIWQTCNPCEKTCQVPNFVCPTQACPITSTSTSSPTPSALGLGSFGMPLFQGRCVCRPEKVRNNDGRCVDLDECNATSPFNLIGMPGNPQFGQPGRQPGPFGGPQLGQPGFERSGPFGGPQFGQPGQPQFNQPEFGVPVQSGSSPNPMIKRDISSNNDKSLSMQQVAGPPDPAPAQPGQPDNDQPQPNQPGQPGLDCPLCKPDQNALNTGNGDLPSNNQQIRPF